MANSNSKYTPDYRAKVIERVRAGESMSKIAASLKVSSGLIYLWAKNEGLTGAGKPVPADKRPKADLASAPKARVRKRSHQVAPKLAPTFFPPVMNKAEALAMQERIEDVQRLAKMVGVDEAFAHMIFVKGGLAAMDLLANG